MNLVKLPYSENLNIGLLTRVFDRNRISNCYKYFWFESILELITESKTIFTYDEILNQMIEDAWYMVTEYNLRLGPCNTKDNLEEVVRYIFSKENLSSAAPRGTIVDYLNQTSDAQIRRFKRDLILNVPYCMQSPFYTSIKNPDKYKVDEINKQEHLLYYFIDIQAMESHIKVNDEWVEYLVRNKDILQAWVNYNLLGYLQDRNPSVPGIIDKLKKPEKRDLKRVSNYWKTIIEIDPSITDIYGNVVMKDETISIDHFVPWQFVAHDELWNLSPTTRSINSQKGNHLPEFDKYFSELSKLEYRAYKICNQYELAKEKYEICKDYYINSMEVRNHLYVEGLDDTEFNEVLFHIVKPVYDSAKMCGFSEWKL